MILVNFCSRHLFIILHFCTLYFALCNSVKIEDNEIQATSEIRDLRLLTRFKRSAFGNGLYPPEEYPCVVYLDNTNFADKVLNSDTAWCVQYYYDWCGHCRNFKTDFDPFAEHVCKWNSTVQVGAINCADSANKPICDDNGIASVPTLKYFQRKSTAYEDAKRISAIRNPDKLKHQLAENVVQEYAKTRYKDWPNFDKIATVKTQLDLFWEEAPSTAQILVIIFEKDPDSMTGVELLLDLHWIKSMYVRRAASTHSIPQELGITQFPNLAVFARNDSVSKPSYQSNVNASEDSIGPMLRDVVLNFTMGEQNQKNFTTASTTPQPIITPTNDSSLYYCSETDVLLALWYAIFNEIPAKGDIGGSNLTAAINFLDHVKKYLRPGANAPTVLRFYNLSEPKEATPNLDKFQQIIADMVNHLKQSTATKMTPEEWKQLFTYFEAKHNNPIPKTADWQHCIGSKPQHRGYTCGLWTTFHLLSVNAFLSDATNASFNPLHLPQAIEGFVKNFFGCTHCAQHFVYMVNTEFPMQNEINNSADVMMYLWRAHNRVNSRLHNDITEDPAYPKYQFPANFLCPPCRKLLPDGRPAWSGNDVLKFLINYYTQIKPHSTTSSNSEVDIFKLPSIGSK